jgi:hypothetical protein
MAQKKIAGYILENTFSKIDGAPIVVVATMKSGNVKTGNMAQVWILREDIAPTDAVKSRCDESVCGDCSHRGTNAKNRTCYVTVFQAPLAVWKAYHRGNYVNWNGDASVFVGRKIRWGAYGDPALISPSIVEKISNASAGWTGYTHMWCRDFSNSHKSFLQASCDSVADLDAANASGWATFTVLPIGYDSKNLGRKVTQCPSALTDGRVQCISCGLCNGASKFAHNIVIAAHGRNAQSVTF